MRKMNITPHHIFIAGSLALNFLLAALLGTALHGRENSRSEAQYMVAQRVAVLEVEQFITSRQPWRNTAEIRGYAEMIVDAATEFHVPPLRVARVAIAESSLNHKAVGDGGKSIGVMQVSTKWWIGTVPFITSAKDLRNPANNIRAGAWILGHYAERCGQDEESILACYNGGEKPNEQARAYAMRVAGGA